MPIRKKNPKKKNDTIPENASPVCYINSPELRPEFKEEVDETLNTPTQGENKRTHKNGEKKK